MNDLQRLLRKAIDKMVTQRNDLTKRIVAMEASYRLISGSPATVKPKRKPRKKKARTLDRKATEKTLAFIRSRKRPTSPEAIEREFGISRAAATQRCINLVKQGMIRRVAKARYQDPRPVKQVAQA